LLLRKPTDVLLPLISEMRLLHTTSLELEEFLNPPRYTILPHAWDNGEVKYSEILKPTEGSRNKAGITNIEEFAFIARQNGYVPSGAARQGGGTWT